MKILSFPSHSKGASLIEVLVSIVILSFGLLGLAGFQIVGLSANNGSTMRTIATQQAYDMADRIRANPDGIVAIPSHPNSGVFYDNISGIGADPGCGGGVCIPGQMAAYDTFQWNTANAALLPSGKGTVKRIGSFFEIAISWDDSKGQQPLRTFVVRFEP